MANRLRDYEEHQFFSFVETLWNAELSQPDHDRLIAHFDRIVTHPAGSDLIFYSGSEAVGIVNSPANVVATLKSWHQQNGLTAFKGQVPTPPLVRQPLTREQRASQSSSRNLQQVRNRLADIQALAQQVTRQLADLEQRVALDPQADTPDEQLAASLEALRELESVQHQASRTVKQLEQMSMAVKFALDAARRDASSPFLDTAIQAMVLQEATAASQLHGAALAATQARHPALYGLGVEMIERLEARIARLAEVTATGPGYGPLTLRAAANSAGLHPALLTARGLSREVAGQQYHLIKTFRSAVAELQWQATSLASEHPGTCIDVVEFVPSTPSDDPRYAMTIPLAEMFDSDHLDLAALAQQRAEVDVPVRLYCAMRGAGAGTASGVKPFTRYAHVLMTSTQGRAVPGAVRVRPAVWDASRQSFVFTCEGPAAVTVEWHEGRSAYAVEDHSRPPGIGFLRMPKVPLVEPLAEPARFDDYIVVFPPASGMVPVYLMFSAR
ncbi:S-type pyocin domain-containing protein [Pseudomonas parasichuanensis]|nr:S-type pyocin domain-containing protein [Pseudomonas parasichuanensis]